MLWRVGLRTCILQGDKHGADCSGPGKRWEWQVESKAGQSLLTSCLAPSLGSSLTIRSIGAESIFLSTRLSTLLGPLQNPLILTMLFTNGAWKHCLCWDKPLMLLKTKYMDAKIPVANSPLNAHENFHSFIQLLSTADYSHYLKSLSMLRASALPRKWSWFKAVT